MGALDRGAAREPPLVPGPLLFPLAAREPVMGGCADRDPRLRRAVAGEQGDGSYVAGAPSLCNGPPRSRRPQPGAARRTDFRRPRPPVGPRAAGDDRAPVERRDDGRSGRVSRPPEEAAQRLRAFGFRAEPGAPGGPSALVAVTTEP